MAILSFCDPPYVTGHNNNGFLKYNSQLFDWSDQERLAKTLLALTNHQVAHNPALKVNPDPTLKYGNRKQEVHAAIQKFNEVNRKDGLRDLCEIVERETERLVILASNRGVITLDELAIKRMKWDHQINVLASAAQYSPGTQPLLTAAFATDLHSFRDARNLVDHKVRSKREDIKRERQYADKMMQGPRLMAELVTLQRKIK